jgi:hypothetical protein
MRLKAFQFVEGVPECPQYTQDDKDYMENKENTNPQSHLSSKERPLEPACASQPDNNSPMASAKPAPPSTPDNNSRYLPLNHLLGVGPTAGLFQKPADQEEVQWRQGTPHSSHPVATPAKRKKRARSSSPPSASVPQPNPSQFKTPKQDPAGEVWSRFRGDGHATESAIRASQSGVETLLVHSSPRSSEVAGNVGGLRRYTSCGTKFPTSNKRRKLENDRGVSLQAPIAEEPACHLPKTSKIRALLELQESERQQLLHSHKDSPIERAPSSSSPFPAAAKYPSQPIEAESPLHARRASGRSPTPQDYGIARKDAAEEPPAAHSPSSSEYSDMAIDSDELNVIFESTARQLELNCEAKSGQHISNSPEGRPSSSATIPPNPIGTENVGNTACENEMDSFDLSEDDWAEAELQLERLTQAPAQQNDMKQPNQEQTGTGTAQHPIQLEDEFEGDEFGDDVDMDAFIAAEALATQAGSMEPAEDRVSCTIVC